MVLTFIATGLLMLAASIWAWRRNRFWIVSEMPMLWKKFWRLRWFLGLSLGIASFFTRYTLQGGDGIYTVHGFPFIAYAFDQDGRDYVSALTMPFMFMNFIAWLFLPQFFFWFFAYLDTKSKKTTA